MARGRPRRPRSNSAAPSQAATTGYEAELWRMADALRGSMDAAEYKHVVLGLVFLKYISDAARGDAGVTPTARCRESVQGADPEDLIEANWWTAWCASENIYSGSTAQGTVWVHR